MIYIKSVSVTLTFIMNTVGTTWENSGKRQFSVCSDYVASFLNNEIFQILQFLTYQLKGEVRNGDKCL